MGSSGSPFMHQSAIRLDFQLRHRILKSEQNSAVQPGNGPCSREADLVPKLINDPERNPAVVVTP